MKKFVVFGNGIMIDIEKIVVVAPNPSSPGSVIYTDLQNENTKTFWTVEEKTDEVRALIQKVLGSDVSFAAK